MFWICLHPPAQFVNTNTSDIRQNITKKFDETYILCGELRILGRNEKHISRDHGKETKILEKQCESPITMHENTFKDVLQHQANIFCLAIDLKNSQLWNCETLRPRGKKN